MPHLTLEYSANLPGEIASRGLLLSLHRALARVGGIRLGNCKSRAVRRESFAVGDGEEEGAFVHLDVRFLEGRSPETRHAIGEELLRLLREAYAAAGGPGLQITVEVGEIARAAYFKHPPGTLEPRREPEG